MIAFSTSPESSRDLGAVEPFWLLASCVVPAWVLSLLLSFVRQQKIMAVIVRWGRVSRAGTSRPRRFHHNLGPRQICSLGRPPVKNFLQCLQDSEESACMWRPGPSLGWKTSQRGNKIPISAFLFWRPCWGSRAKNYGSQKPDTLLTPHFHW